MPEDAARATVEDYGYDDTYRGEASFTLNVPREQRHATGTSEARYRAGRYDHTIRTVNGWVVYQR